MNYYKRHIGDYAKKTGRLTILEHGAYTLLIDACYDRERFPTEAEAIEWSWARTEEEVAAVKFVLARFFTFEGGFYVQKRIAEELGQYAANAAINKKIATEREAKRKASAQSVNEPCTNRSPDVHEPPPNHKPLTNNQEEKEKTNKKENGAEAPLQTQASAVDSVSADKPHRKTPRPASQPDMHAELVNRGCTEQVAADFLKIRSAQKAPLTATAIAGIEREADKASFTFPQAIAKCVERNWRAFEAGWVQNQSRPTSSRPVAAMTVSERNAALLAQVSSGIVGNTIESDARWVE